jgi:ankyrin repeat protein
MLVPMIALSELESESDDVKLKEVLVEVKDDKGDDSIIVVDGVDVNVRNKSQRSALHYAAMADKDDFVVAFIKSKADINLLDIYSKSPLDYCSPRSDTSVVLKQSGADGWTALMVAAELGNTEWNRYFELREAILSQQDRLPFPDGFQRSVDGINSVEDEDQIIGLDNSLWTEEADSLIEDIHKAGQAFPFFFLSLSYPCLNTTRFAGTITDHNSAEMHRLGALFVHRAQEKVSWDTAGSRGSPSPKQPYSGVRQSVQKNSPKSLGALFVRFQALASLKKMLSDVAGHGNPQNVQGLILCRTDINAQKRDRCTALHIAAISGHEECVQQLIELKADIDSKDTKHRNALHYAAKSGKVDVILTLVKLRADINATDRKGLSALDLASGSKNCSQLLKKLGAGGWTPLMVALDQGSDFPEKYFKIREAVLCMKRGFPFPAWFQTDLRSHLSSSLVSEGDRACGLDNTVWADEETCVLEQLPNAGR